VADQHRGHFGGGAALKNAKDRQGRPLNLSRAQIVAKLSAGRPAQTLLVATKNSGISRRATSCRRGSRRRRRRRSGRTKQALPAIKPYPADLRMSAALDVALFGHLTPATERRLRLVPGSRRGGSGCRRTVSNIEALSAPAADNTRSSGCATNELMFRHRLIVQRNDAPGPSARLSVLGAVARGPS
jgi:hypothetical protein